ncbi:MAG: ABC transporter ATP-binding protein [Promethearchaeota archaeon]
MIFQTEIIDIVYNLSINFIISFLISWLIAFFYLNWDDRSQLINKKFKIELISTIPGISYMIISIFLLNTDLLQDILIISIISIISSFILKIFIYNKMGFEKLSQITKLETGRPLLKVKNLKVYYPLLGGILKRQIGAVKAVDGISFNIRTGETLGLVGESGCGKTTVAKAILHLVETHQGAIFFNDTLIQEKFSSYLRQKIQIVFQDPDASLNPRLKVVDIIAEPLKNLLGITKKKDLRKYVLRLMEEVSLKLEHLDRFPHEFSGGQKQRIVIARALASNPELLILDEPTSALDVSVQAQILNLLKNLQKKYGYGYLFITHNLSVVNHIADRVAVMYLGRFVEIGTVDQIFNNPTHPYTQALLASRSEIDPYNDDIKFIIKGEVPSPINPPLGCPFHPRCSSDTRTKECDFKTPHMIKIEEDHYIWCNYNIETE